MECVSIFAALYYSKFTYELKTSPSHVLSQLDKCIREASTLDGVLEVTNEHFWQLSFGQLVFLYTFLD